MTKSSSNVGGISEIITDDVGLLIDPNDSSTLASAIDKIIGDDEFRQNLASNARERAIEECKWFAESHSEGKVIWEEEL